MESVKCLTNLSTHQTGSECSESEKGIDDESGEDFADSKSEDDKLKLKMYKQCLKCHMSLHSLDEWKIHLMADCQPLHDNNRNDSAMMMINRGQKHDSNSPRKEVVPCSDSNNSCGSIDSVQTCTLPNKRSSSEHKRNKRKELCCPACPKMFKWPYELKNHLLGHTGDLPHSCVECGKTFGKKTSRDRHMITHTGEKQYSCPICNKMFAWSSTLKSHLSNHTGVRPHRCSYCNKTFLQKAGLDRHKRTHNDLTTLSNT